MIRTTILAALLLTASHAMAGGSRVAGPVPAEVISVYDGDTLTVRATVWVDQVLETRVRVAGIDAPEIRGRCAEERDLAQRARTALAEIAGAAVQLVDVRPDKYGDRVRARVLTADGRDIAALLIAAGLARPYHGERRQPWCEVTP